MFGAALALGRFVARFVEHCEPAAPALRGTVTFRAT
jgi:hypothetical protein